MSDDTTPLADAASQMHELFMAYVTAGFSRLEALQLVIAVATAGIKRDGDAA